MIYSVLNVEKISSIAYTTVSKQISFSTTVAVCFFRDNVNNLKSV